MANKEAAVKATITYTDADGQSASIPALTMRVPYQAQLHGSTDVPDTAAAGAFVIPFGSIAKATGAVIENRTSGPVNVSINAGDLTYSALAPGDSCLVAFPMTPGAAPVSAISVSTTEVQAGEGAIGFHLWGDPV